ncbi:MAG: type II toxin-antitoxin system HicB family antitoxin [Candidatus Hodarchaeota archaeon]
METAFTAIYQKVPEGYIGYVQEIPGVNSQGDTLEEVRENLKEALELILACRKE